jgi:hypothetical protein
LPKVHSLHHITQYIALYGVPNNTDGSRAESIAKENAKEPAKRTKRQSHKVECQVGPKIVNKILLDTSMEYVQEEDVDSDFSRKLDKFVRDTIDSNETDNNSEQDREHEPLTNDHDIEPDELFYSASRKLSGTRIIIQRLHHNVDTTQHLDQIFRSNKERDEYGNPVHYIVQMCGRLKRSFCTQDTNLFQYLVDNLLSSINEHKLVCYTEYVDNGPNKTIFRTHHNYRNNGPWYDSAMVTFNRPSSGTEDDSSLDSSDCVDCVSILGLFIRLEESTDVVDTEETLEEGEYCVFRSQLDYEEMEYYRSDSRRQHDDEKNIVERVRRGRNMNYCSGSNKIVSVYKMDPRKIYIQHIDTINHPCMVIPYEVEEKHLFESEVILLVKRWNDWGSNFIIS